MFYSVVSRVVASIFLAAAATVSLSPFDVSAQQVKDTKIRVTVCPGSADQSGFSIDEPGNDSVVGSAAVTVEGSVQNISQIDFFVDDTYRSSITLSTADTRYSHMVTLVPGTHVIKLVAQDSCQQHSHTQSVVITFAPGATPSTGPTTPTRVPGAGGPSISTPEANFVPVPEQDREALVPENSPIPVPRSADDIARGLDLDTSLDDSGSIWRTVSVVLGLIFLAAIPAMLGHRLVLPLVSKFRKNRFDNNQQAKPKISHSHHHHMIMRLFGLALIVLPFLV